MYCQPRGAAPAPAVAAVVAGDVVGAPPPAAATAGARAPVVATVAAAGDAAPVVVVVGAAPVAAHRCSPQDFHRFPREPLSHFPEMKASRLGQHHHQFVLKNNSLVKYC